MIYQALRCLSVALCMVAAPVTVAETATIALTVENIQSQKGSLFVSVYDSSDTFLGEEKVFAQEVALDGVENGTLLVEMTLPYGEYAISVHHDNNANGKMDSNFIGLPKEPVGLSNGHVPRFGPPKFTKAVIAVSAPAVSETIALID